MSAPAAPGAPAAAIVRGVARALGAADHAVLVEVPLANGRRADVLAIDRHGTVTIVEVKSSRADFASDRKWRDYLDFCDRFTFAVGAGFPLDLLPAHEGCLLADAYGAEELRPPQHRPLSAARRKAVLLRFGRLAAMRLQHLLDPMAP